MKKKIVLVDDKVSIGKIASIYLSKDYDYTFISNPLELIDWLKSGNNPDLIISDIRMPGMTGVELFKYLKSNLLYKTIPVIFLSSEDSTAQRIQLLEEGAADYIVKPFNPLELKVRVKKVIG